MKTLRMVPVFCTALILSACSMFSGNEETTAATPAVPAQANANAVANAGMIGSEVNQQTGQEQNVVVNMTGGTSIAPPSMNANDQSRMSHGLDAALGKSDSWSNASTGYSYTVTPIKKVLINGNPFCREYGLVIVNNGNREAIRGTACVMTDGNWHRVS